MNSFGKHVQVDPLMFSCDYFNSISPCESDSFIFLTLKMSSAIVYNCATYSKTVKGKQDYGATHCLTTLHASCHKTLFISAVLNLLFNHLI